MNKFIIFITGILVFGACNNELDLIEEWKDIPIVYAIIDPADTAHYLRIEKAFIDPYTSGLDLAKEVDSLYYDEIEVSLIKKSSGQRFELVRVDGNLEGYPRVDGVFAQAPNYLYKIKSAVLGLTGAESLTLEIKRANNENPVISNTKTIGSYKFLRPRPDDPEKINLSYANHITIRWNRAENAIDYEVYITTHYEEKYASEPDENYIPREVIWKAASGVENNSVLLPSKEFYTFLGSAVETNSALVRRFKNLQFTVIAVGQELSDFIEIGGVNLGITASQEIPQYSNISEGLGVFSSKWEINLKGLRVTPTSLDSIINGSYTKHLNFQ